MVGRHRRKPHRRLMVSHQRCWIWGRNVVRETLRAGLWPVVDLTVSDGLSAGELHEVRQLAQTAGVPLGIAPDRRLTQLCGARDHQGWLARMAPYPYRTLAELLQQGRGPGLVALLDGVQDPFNFGAIVRSAHMLGVSGIVVPATGQAEVNSLVARSSAGAVNFLPIAQVDELTAAVTELQGQNFRILAATEKAAAPLDRAPFADRCAVVLGNEGRGISEPLLEMCDERYCIPQSGPVGSLNVAVAAGIVFYEALRQRTAAGMDAESRRE